MAKMIVLQSIFVVKWITFGNLDLNFMTRQ